MANQLSYWIWFLRGSGGGPGWRQFIDPWILLHILVGALFGFWHDLNLQHAANAVLLPLAGIFVGLSFAWAGNAQALMQSAEFDTMADFHDGGFRHYVFTFQSAILSILVTLVLWGLAGLGLFDQPCPWQCPQVLYPAMRGILFFLASLTLRECWHVILGAQWMLLAQRNIKRRLAETDHIPAVKLSVSSPGENWGSSNDD